MKQDQILQKAINLRKQGYSLREISEKLNIAKSTTSLWLRNVKLNKKAKERIKYLGVEGRLRSNKTSRAKRQAIWQRMADHTIIFKKGLSDYSIDELKVLLAMLYWGEGYKNGRSVVFMNSDPNMVKVYLFLLRQCFKIKEEKLKAVIHLHEYHNKEEMIDYWSKVAKIDKKQIRIYEKSNTGIRKKEGYKGCLSIRYYNALIFDEIMLIIDRFQISIAIK